MALQIKIKWKGKCQRHTRFNPEKDGRGGIRGACPSCEALMVVYESSLAVKKMISICEGTEPTEQQAGLAFHS